MNRFGFSAVFLSLTCVLLPAVTEPIGEAISAGNIVVNNASAAGNATVFEGSTLGSGSKNSTQVRLTSGAQLRLFLDSEGKLYRDHVDLISGSAEISGYAANANGLKITADSNSSAEVSKQGKTIQVAALSGDVHVFNAQGISVANLLPGRIMSFFPQDAGASAPSSLTGCPVRNGSNFMLTDETSNVTVQLRGGNVRAGRRVQVTGTMVPNATPPAGATQVINVTGVKEVGGSCQGAAGAAAGAGGGAAAGGGGGHAAIYIGAAAAVIAGVTAAVVATQTSDTVSGTIAGSTSTVTFYNDSAGNIFAVTTVTSNGNTTQTITETTPSGVTTTLGSLPTTTSDPGLKSCLSPCH